MMKGCWQCGARTPKLNGKGPGEWWLVELPGRTERLCSAECVFLAYPWTLQGRPKELRRGQ